MFIRGKNETHIKKFFMDDIDKLLEKYEPGDPKMKPDVLKQLKEIETERAQLLAQEQAKSGQIVMNQPGQPPVTLTTVQIVEIIKGQQAQLEQLSKNAQQLNQMNEQLQQLLISKQQEISKLTTENSMLKRVTMGSSPLTPFTSPLTQGPSTKEHLTPVPIINPVFNAPLQSDDKVTPKFTITDSRLF
jgi:hypothetical protein